MSIQTATSRKSVALWKNNSLALILSSVLLLTAGSKIYEIILPLLMYEITHSSIVMSNMRTAELLPNFFLAIVIGIIVDRVNKKKWVIWMIGLQAGLMLLFVYLYQSDIRLLFLYYLVGFLLMSFNYGYFNAQVSLLKHSVTVNELTAANARVSLVETLIGIMGPCLTSLILLLHDVSNGILITACCYLICVVLFIKLPVSESPTRKLNMNFLHDLREGWNAFRNNKLLWKMTMFVIFANCTSTVVGTTTIFFAKDNMRLSSSVLSIVLSFTGVGGVIGSFLVSRMRKRIGLGKVYALAIIFFSLAYFLFYLTTNQILLFSIALFVYGLAISLPFHSFWSMIFSKQKNE